MVKIEVIGLKALDKQLRALPDATLRKVVRPATSKAMTPVLQDARKRAKEIKDTGLLAKSLGRKSKSYIKKGVVVHLVGPRTGFKREVTRDVIYPDGVVVPIKITADPSRYAHLVEFGTSPHRLGAGGAIHPGAKAKPFMRPAFDSNENQILAIYRDELRKGVIREALKLKAKRRG